MRTFIIILTSAAALVGAPATAGPARVQVVSDTLAFHTQAVSSPAEAQRFLARIRRVANNLCQTGERSMMAAPGAQARACRDAAVARAVQTLGSPAVSAAFEAERNRVQLANR